MYRAPLGANNIHEKYGDDDYHDEEDLTPSER